jgi:hypothetical protein
MSSPEPSPPPTDRQSLDAGAVRAGVLALLARPRQARRYRSRGRAPAARLQFMQGNCLQTPPATSSAVVAGLYGVCACVGAGFVVAQANNPPMPYEPFARRRWPWAGESRRQH